MQETVLSPQNNAQQNFRIFWVGMHSRGNIDDILWRAIKSKHIVKYFSSMPNIYMTGNGSKIADSKKK